MKSVKAWIRNILLLTAMVMLVVGLRMDGFRDTLSKAVMICLECVGIG